MYNYIFKISLHKILNKTFILFPDNIYLINSHITIELLIFYIKKYF